MNSKTLSKSINGLVAIEASTIQKSSGQFYEGITSNLQNQFDTLSSSIFYYGSHSNNQIINNIYNYNSLSSQIYINNTINNYNYNTLSDRIQNIYNTNNIQNNYNLQVFNSISGQINNIQNYITTNNNIQNYLTFYVTGLSGSITKILESINNINSNITNNYNIQGNSINNINNLIIGQNSSISGLLSSINTINNVYNIQNNSINTINNSITTISGVIGNLQNTINNNMYLNNQSISSFINDKYNIRQPFNLVPINQSITINDLYNIQNTKGNIAFSINDLYDTCEIIDNRQRSGISRIDRELLISNVSRGVFSALSVGMSLLNMKAMAQMGAAIGLIQFQLFTLSETVSAMNFTLKKMQIDIDTIHRRTRNLNGSTFNSYLQVEGDLYVGTSTTVHSTLVCLGELKVDQQAKFSNVEISKDINVNGKIFNGNGSVVNSQFEDIEI